ncbi:phage tail protein [Escherichia coli]|uniref:gp53-like domain-containing protein n=2 Tax=Escherichia coli TaxID=562 RepID=UPI001E4F4A3E|nr:phage tail protein [Escherichia coli]MBG0896547.1 phage tail protein [Escherichia coli]MCE3572241.1 phage tail protein [Escherichia coli]MCJ8658842.1 phage tail protein [Escherichia coli]MDH6977969.1 phage tail protein [Escherichia coli]MDH7033091.1 phage tail protein [Escherichia coli]
MAINNFKPFALDPNANVTSQADWEALPALLSGFTAGKASSAQVNKAIRQASFIAAALAQYTANKSGLDVLDDGDLNGFISKMGTAFGKDFQALDATLTALAGLETGANKLPYFTGNDTAAQTDLTSVGRDIIGKKTIADILTYLGLGETINKASGAMQKSANGSDISDVSAFRNALQLGTAATRDVGADNASKLLDLGSFMSMMSGNGYIYIPCIATTGNPVKLMLQWGTVATQKGVDAIYALPFAFPYAGLFATGNRGTSGYNAAMNVRIASRTHISIQNWAPSGEGTEDCCFIALGY